jgi:CheY-like chemotaxis protein
MHISSSELFILKRGIWCGAGAADMAYRSLSSADDRKTPVRLLVNFAHFKKISRGAIPTGPQGHTSSRLRARMSGCALVSSKPHSRTCLNERLSANTSPHGRVMRISNAYRVFTLSFRRFVDPFTDCEICAILDGREFSYMPLYWWRSLTAPRDLQSELKCSAQRNPEKGENVLARRQHHIVLIQNDSYLVETRTALLISRGYSVEVVQSVREAKSQCQNFKCDLVIVDANKAHNPAMELCEEIKQHNPSQNVVLMTGYHVYLHTECPDEIIAQEEGPEGFIAKIENLLSPSSA